MSEIESLNQENAELKEELRKALIPQWFYADGSEEYCMSDPSEVIDFYDFEPGIHVAEIACARPVPSLWYSVHVLTDIEREELKTSEYWLAVEFDNEADARANAEKING